MVGAGWDHAALMAMREDEFRFWLGEQIELERLRADARRKAIEEARRR